ncbi:VCBS repeat-containing protein [Paenibacillus sp. KQZ6P-2]|uniref:VCBS repeat-containing protein n=1 Tax=Paenibacillus mangrovi TaxID=2931978 RepID=A0A9X1WNI2_9BACL|nr:VCBS repeat-containing protein [Paenibacillus mangrovi]MCJ8012188.1 VCBS repeat-containing protein [Paenibacillus mangrovi]
MNIKKVLTSTMIASLVLSGSAMAASNNSNNSFKLPSNMYKLAQKQVDVTGDKKADVITLYGHKEKASDAYNDELLLVINNGKTKKTTSIPLHDGGYSPVLLVPDLNNDKVADIMVTADTGGTGGYITSHIYTLINSKPVEFPQPGLAKGKVGVQGNGFIQLKPVALNNKGAYALQGVERVGTTQADTTSYVTSNWKWIKGKWQLNGKKVTKPNSSQEQAKNTVYKNSEANFSVAIPSSWNGHYKVRHEKSDVMFPSAKHVVYFDYVTKDKKDYQPLITISVYAKNDWKKLSDDDKSQIGGTIAEANGMVYVVTTPQSNPFDPQSADGKKFDQMYKDLNLKKAFSILKK